MRTLSCAGALLLVAAWSPSRSAPRPSQDSAVCWRKVGTGVEKALYDVTGAGEGSHTRIVAVRVDPSRFRFRLRARINGVMPAWSVDRAPSNAVVAFNAGQFNGITPWGWLVTDGQEIRPPGTGPLSAAIAWDRAGGVHWLTPGEIDQARASGDIVEALQSFPVLVDGNGRIPRAIRERGLGVDVEHQDARLAVGLAVDGRLVVALTRFHGLGPLSPAIPLGLTLSEMADVMRGLGCVRAVSLDGGVSAQLLLRSSNGRTLWRGWRNVPLGLVAEPRTSSSGGRELPRPGGE